jgi:hypothetical protein
LFDLATSLAEPTQQVQISWRPPAKACSYTFQAYDIDDSDGSEDEDYGSSEEWGGINEEMNGSGDSSEEMEDLEDEFNGREESHAATAAQQESSAYPFGICIQQLHIL